MSDKINSFRYITPWMDFESNEIIMSHRTGYTSCCEIIFDIWKQESKRKIASKRKAKKN